MKALIWAIDRFCYKHPRFGIPNLMLYIIIGNAIVFMFSAMDTTNSFFSLLTLAPYHIMHGQVWRLISFIIIPPFTNMRQTVSLFFTLYFYYFIGSTLERQWGSGKFTIYYFSGVILTVIYAFVVWLLMSNEYIVVSITMYYVNLSMFFAFATMFPDNRVMLFMIIPIKVKWLALLNAILFIYGIVTTAFPANLLPIIAILNYLIFCGGYLIDYLRPYVGYRRKSNKTINYKKAAKKVNKDLKDKSYSRKCAVCGKTDKDHPEMEFRFCSRCEGYHCFCEEHINNHVHFKE